MRKQNHIIRKLIIEVGIPRKEQAFDIQNRISEEFKRSIFHQIELLLDRLSGSMEIIRIEKLAIDIGQISSQKMEEKLSSTVVKELELTLVKLLHELRNSPDGIAAVRITTSTNDSFTIHATRKKKYESDLEIMIHYLEFGVFPWTGDNSRRPSLREMMALMMEKVPDQLQNRLCLLASKRVVFRRLVQQLPEEQIFFLASILGCHFSSQLSMILKETEAHFFQFTRSSKKGKTAYRPFQSSYRSLFLERTLQYFASSRNGQSTNDLTSNEQIVKFVWSILNELPGEPIPSSGAVSIQTSSMDLKTVVKAVVKGFLKEHPRFRIENRTTKEHTANQKKATGSTLPPDSSFSETNEISPDSSEGIYIANAGIIILHPYLPAFFTNVGLILNKQFISKESRERAVQLLHWLVYGDEEREVITEHDLVLNKLLCGISVSSPVSLDFIITDKEKKMGLNLLKAIIGNWPALKSTSPHGLRKHFLQKEGRLSAHDPEWHLLVKRESAVEVLVDRIPWSISMIKLPWNDFTIYAQW